MSPKFTLFVMMAFLAVPSMIQAQTSVVPDATIEVAPDETIVVREYVPEAETARTKVSQRPGTRLSAEEIQRRVEERATQIKADEEEVRRVKDLRKADKTKEDKQARRQIEQEAKRDQKAFEKAEIIGCSADETVVHPEANTKTWGPKVKFEVHNPHDYPIDLMSGTKIMIEKLCPKGIAKVSVSAWVIGPIATYGTPYAPYGGRRRDGRDMKIIRLTAKSDHGVVFSPEVVVDYYQTLYEGNRRDPYIWIVPDPQQASQAPVRPGAVPGVPTVSMYGTSRELSVPMPGYIQRSLMLPSEREALEQQAEPVVPDEVIVIESVDNR